jgi:ABC-type multidrug transport system permease subunit
MLLIFTSTFANMLVAGFDSDEVAGALCTLFLIMLFTFNGVLATPEQLPGFWIFMYRVNPFTYVIDGFLSSALADAPVSCAANEILTFSSPANTTCGEYLAGYIERVGGYVVQPNVADVCEYCSMESTNAFLSSLNIDFSNRWRSFGILWVYVVFNIVAAVFIYWLVRVPKAKKEEKLEVRIEEKAEA